MHILSTVKDTFGFLDQNRRQGVYAIGLVPTMGALHEGHLALVKQSISENELTVVSIFVNPIQFNNSEDFDKYPSTLEHDIKLLESVGCNAVFLPNKTEMYPQETLVKISFGYLDTVLEGEFRPNHFSGVGIVVSKLFNIIQPQKAYFGQKDLQQFLVIKQLVNDLSIPVELVMCDIERDNDGLALSSRNARLTESGLIEARKINKLLKSIISDIQISQNLGSINNVLDPFIDKNPQIKIEYLRIVNANTLKEISSYNECESKGICIAAYIEEVRLIDNMIF